MMEKLYDYTSAKSILEHAKKLLGCSLSQSYSSRPKVFDETSNNKGQLGSAVEAIHFNYSPNSSSEPDFPEAGLELKCTPLKELADGSMVSKERLVLNIINYLEEVEVTFSNSSFWKKNKALLLMFYLYEKDKSYLDYIFKIVRTWKFPEEDLKIIQDDWSKIHTKIISGRAHELSEGDTLYLGACIKGSRGGANKRNQPNSEIKADQRAYSLKSKYLNTIIHDSIFQKGVSADVALSDRQKKKIERQKATIANAVKSLGEYKKGETFEELIERKFSVYYDKTIDQIEEQLETTITSSPKAISYDVIRKILKVDAEKIAEFEKADILVKSIRLEPNGGLVEAMSFSQINYNEIVEEEIWEESVWYNILTRRFLFVVFEKSPDGGVKASCLKKVFFWTMPTKDLEIAKLFWKDTRDKIKRGDFEHFIAMSDNKICHVRPKARNSMDTILTSFGYQKKKAYWLNRSYILNIVHQNLGT